MKTHKPQPLNTLGPKMGKLAERTSFFIPNTKQGLKALETIKKYANGYQWTVALRGRGKRDNRREWQSLPLAKAEYFAVYLRPKNGELISKEQLKSLYARAYGSDFNQQLATKNRELFEAKQRIAQLEAELVAAKYEVEKLHTFELPQFAPKSRRFSVVITEDSVS